MKYRVLQDGGLFYPQERFFCFWVNFWTDWPVAFLTKDEAIDFIKNKTEKKVVWTDEDNEGGDSRMEQEQEDIEIVIPYDEKELKKTKKM